MSQQSIPTLAEVEVEMDDGIGVIQSSANALQPPQTIFSLDRDMQPDFEEVKRYLTKLMVEFKLAYIRDAQFHGILFNEPLFKQLQL
jgi:hypothetical protein